MRLLLDEHYSPRIAEQLRRNGYDVIAVVEQLELRHMSDRDVFEWAQSEMRVVLTEDVGHFTLIHYALAERGRDHYGLIFTSPKQFPRGLAEVGALIKALAVFLDANQAKDKVDTSMVWLPPVGSPD